MTINYDEEAKLLSNGFWKPPEGETVVKAVSELSDKMELTYPSDTESGKPEIQQKVDLAIEADGERHTWRIAANHSQRSLFGQLVMLAQEMGGLQGKLLRVQRDGTGRGTGYTVTKAAA